MPRRSVMPMIRGRFVSIGVIRGSVPSDESFMLALSIRQPFAELILRGIKTVEYRSRATKIVGERF